MISASPFGIAPTKESSLAEEISYLLAAESDTFYNTKKLELKHENRLTMFSLNSCPFVLLVVE